MRARMTRPAPQSPFELPEVRAVVRATRLSCQNARKAQKFTPVRGSSGESRFRARTSQIQFLSVNHRLTTIDLELLPPAGPPKLVGKKGLCSHAGY
jgi:hypothetical protein